MPGTAMGVEGLGAKAWRGRSVSIPPTAAPVTSVVMPVPVRHAEQGGAHGFCDGPDISGGQEAFPNHPVPAAAASYGLTAPNQSLE